jgi:hypothetical protein
MNYNLLEESWIPILRNDGHADRVGIRAALAQAGAIHRIAAPNPMDCVALLRFLLAVLSWCKPELTNEDRKSLAGAKGIPSAWLKKLDEHEGKFNLLGNADRFFQDEKTKAKTRPIGDLLQEFPTETSIAHFRHVRDGDYGLCPACCATGIIRFCAFANAYGGGRYTSAINGPAPVYAIAQGGDLLQSLLLNWSTTVPKRAPPWLSNKPPTLDSLDIPTAFAWRSRQVWLGALENEAEPCAYCGRSARLVKQMKFTGGWKPPFKTKGQEKKFWDQDPHLILEPRAQRDEADENPREAVGDSPAEEESPSYRPTEMTTIGFPSPGNRVAKHARFWRRALAACLLRHDIASGTATLAAITVAGPAANKGLYQDAAELSFSPPFNHPAHAFRLLNNATQLLTGVLRQSTQNPKQEHGNRKAALDALSPALEMRLRNVLARWLAAGETSLDELIEQVWPTLEAVIASTTFGSPLRRREAAIRAREELERAIARLAEPDKDKEPLKAFGRVNSRKHQ